MEASAGYAVVQALLDEQAALRRVATLVAGGRAEARLRRRDRGGRAPARCPDREHGPLPPRRDRRRDRRLERAGCAERAGRRAAPARRRDAGTEDLPQRAARARRRLRRPHGSLAERLRALGIRSGVGAPIVFNGELWGAVVVSSVEVHAFATGDEHRIAGFTELVAQALANAEAREQLAASRARVVTAGDAERRRLERNLHDGAQQRLVGSPSACGCSTGSSTTTRRGHMRRSRPSIEELVRALPSCASWPAACTRPC